MYLRCHNCDWEQDDFWTEGKHPYHPFIRNDELVLMLFELDKPLKQKFGETFHLEWGREAGLEDANVRDYLLYRLDVMKARIKEMHWATYEEFKNDPNKVCPKCGERKLNLD